jgi:hypothetical protein
MSIVLYLAGRIHGLTYEQASGWRNQVKDYFNQFDYDVEIIDPLTGEEKLSELNRPIAFTDEELTGIAPREVYLKDIESVKKSTHILAYLPNGVGHGTSYEIGYAQGVNNMMRDLDGFMTCSAEEMLDVPYKKIYVVADEPWRDHPFMTSVAGVDFHTTIDSVIYEIISELKENES